MDIEKIMENMNLSDSDKAYIRQNHIQRIEGNVKSIWKVVEDAAGYGSRSFGARLDLTAAMLFVWLLTHCI